MGGVCAFRINSNCVRAYNYITAVIGSRLVHILIARFGIRYNIIISEHGRGLLSEYSPCKKKKKNPNII